MNKMNIKSYLILFAFFAIIIVVVLYFSFKEADKKRAYTELEMIEDKSLFFSISTNINQFLSYVSDNNTNAIMNVLDKNYIDQNINDINNLILIDNSKFKTSSFSPKLMYTAGYNQHFKYFVKGYLKHNVYEEETYVKGEVYFLLNHDIEKNIFSIEIIDKNQFDNYINSSEFNYSEIVANDNNKFSYTSITDENMAILYYNDFYNNMISNPKLAYDFITSDTKSKYFATYNEFEERIKQDDNFQELSVREYNINNEIYTVIDNKNNKYIFTANGVMNYYVTIELDEEQ